MLAVAQALLELAGQSVEVHGEELLPQLPDGEDTLLNNQVGC